MSRLSLDEWGLRLAEVTAERGTCIRRQVGCVLVDVFGGVIATGYNGVARGLSHCNEVVQVPVYDHALLPGMYGLGGNGYRPTTPHACAGSTSLSGTNLLQCEAIHAEINAVMSCSDIHKIETAYVTVSPCRDCVKALMNTSCQKIVFRNLYSHPEAEARWAKTGKQWIHLKGV